MKEAPSKNCECCPISLFIVRIVVRNVIISTRGHIRNHTDRGTSSEETPLAPSNNTYDPGSQQSIVDVHSGQLKVSQPWPIQQKLNQEKGGCTHLKTRLKTWSCPLLRQRLKTATSALHTFSPGHRFGQAASCIAVELRECHFFSL